MERLTEKQNDISTHSLTRRLTTPALQDRWLVLYFNSQPHKEADDKKERMITSEADFNSQPHKEADVLQPHTRKDLKMHFNSQPHKEADGDPLGMFIRFVIFQLTASQGG